MKRLIPAIMFLCFLHAVQGQIERDKALHFVGGNLYGLAGAGIAKQISDGNRWWTFAGAIGGSALIGIGKEAVDASQRENGWDNEDLWATILGGASVGVTIDIFTNHKKDKERKLAEMADHGIAQSIPNHDITVYIEAFQRPPTLNELAMPYSLLPFESTISE